MVEESNVFKGKLEDRPVVDARTFHSSDFLPGIMEQRHLKAPNFIIRFGLAADIPDGTTDVKAFFATDTGALSLWDGDQWLSTTLS